ncbi:MAG: outer membrane beta-barrel protein [Rhodospirillaceae bacterium]|nr:outer membrane beta-barrel protein [Rhodospirillaceae bacterium]
MNKSKMLLAVSAAAITLSGAALAADPTGPYVSLGAGLHMPRTSDILFGAATREADFDNGFLVNGAFGYKFDNNLRLEAELGHREADIDNVSGTAWTGSQKAWSTMANLVYDFDTASNVTPYLGAGLGLSWLGFKDNFRGPTSAANFDGTDKEFTWQGIAGIGTGVTDNLKLFLEYRYIAVGNAAFPANATPATPVISDHSDRSHNLLVGFRYFFGAPPPKAEPPKPAPPPPPPPAAAAPPPPPPVPQKFIVFFDWDKSNLRADAAKIVSDAAAYAKSTGKARIEATGHADTSGTPAYNLALSERRAQAVRNELVRLGIPANEIAVMFRGESQPLVATGDGVREPQNRRVEIELE